MDIVNCTIISNPDTSGLGVRIGYYMHFLPLPILSIMSHGAEKDWGVFESLTTLTVMNVVYAATVLVSMFSSALAPTGLYDGIVLFYLLIAARTTTAFIVHTYDLDEKRLGTLRMVNILHSYLLFFTGFAVFAAAPHFSPYSECNDALKLVVFLPFPVINSGRILCLVLLSLTTLIYTLSLLVPYRGSDVCNRFERLWAHNLVQRTVQHTTVKLLGAPLKRSDGQDEADFDKHLMVKFFLVMSVNSSVVLNTELLDMYNIQPAIPSYTFGSVLSTRTLVWIVTHMLVAHCTSWRSSWGYQQCSL